MQPNRLERAWQFLAPEILKRWNRLTADDLKCCGGHYDLVVEAIRKRYFLSRSHLSLEAEVRDWLNERVAFHEKHGS